MDPDPDPGSFYHQAKKVRKYLDSYCFVTSFDFLSLKMMYMYLQKVINKKTFTQRIRSGYGSTPKSNGSATLLKINISSPVSMICELSEVSLAAGTLYVLH
jgi:hypothetical protein